MDLVSIWEIESYIDLMLYSDPLVYHDAHMWDWLWYWINYWNMNGSRLSRIVVDKRFGARYVSEY